MWKAFSSDWFMTSVMTDRRNSLDLSALPAEFRAAAEDLLARSAMVDELERKVAALEGLTAGQKARISGRTSFWIALSGTWMI